MPSIASLGPVKVPAYGPLGARIMMVGEAPGAEEEKEGQPFVGKAGQTLRRSLSAVGIDPEMVYFTNICKYRPPDNQIRLFFDQNGLPNGLVMEGLLELREEIERVQPCVIVACGNYALWALTGLAKWSKIELPHGARVNSYTGISSWRGSIVECKLVEGYKVIPTWHPSFIMRVGFDNLSIWEVDLMRVKNEADFRDIRLPKKDLIVNPQGTDRKFLQDKLLGSGSIVTFDIEYIGSNLLCVGMTNARDWAFSVRTGSASDLQFVRECLLSTLPHAQRNVTRIRSKVS